MRKLSFIEKELLSLHKENIKKYEQAIKNIKYVYLSYSWGCRPTMFEHLKDDLKDVRKEYNDAKLKILFKKNKNIRPSKVMTLGKGRKNENKNNLRIEF